MRRIDIWTIVLSIVVISFMFHIVSAAPPGGEIPPSEPVCGNGVVEVGEECDTGEVPGVDDSLADGCYGCVLAGHLSGLIGVFSVGFNISASCGVVYSTAIPGVVEELGPACDFSGSGVCPRVSDCFVPGVGCIARDGVYVLNENTTLKCVKNQSFSSGGRSVWCPDGFIYREIDEGVYGCMYTAAACDVGGVFGCDDPLSPVVLFFNVSAGRVMVLVRGDDALAFYRDVMGFRQGWYDASLSVPLFYYPINPLCFRNTRDLSDWRGVRLNGTVLRLVSMPFDESCCPLFVAGGSWWYKWTPVVVSRSG